MKKLWTMLLLCTLSLSTVYAQPKQRAGVRMEVADSETDHGDYSIFTYKDTDEDDSFGYYLSLGRVNNTLGADEILGVNVQNIDEVTIWLGSTTDEALDMLGRILDLYDEDVDTSVEFRGRSVNGAGHLEEPTTSTCVVEKKTLGGKRLRFLFKKDKGEGHAFLTKAVVKELRTNFKIDVKLHPKRHIKK